MKNWRGEPTSHPNFRKDWMWTKVAQLHELSYTWSNSTRNNLLRKQEFMYKRISIKSLNIVDPESFGRVVNKKLKHEPVIKWDLIHHQHSHSFHIPCNSAVMNVASFALDSQWKYELNIGRPIRCVYLRYLKILSTSQMFGTLSPFAHWNSHWTFLLYHSFDTNHWRGVSVLVYTEGRMFAPVCIVPTQTVVF
jgi:hypothetical protein